MRLRVCMVLIVAAPVMALAQRVSGTVRVEGASTPLSGVVVSLTDSAGRTVGRALTDDNGRYAVALPPAAAQLRATRIGFRPGTAAITRGAAADLTIDLLMERTPMLLATMHVAADASCGNTAEGQFVLQVWEQARSALLASVVAREARRAQVTLLRYERRMEPARRLVTEQVITISGGMSAAPVAAARSAAQLASSGYSAGAVSDRVYFAPDADVLLDDSFGATHCLGLTNDPAGRPGQIGLTFTPRRRPSHVFAEVRGTLWIDPQAAELVQLDYRYTDIDPAMESAGAGGTMHFRAMPNGVVFIDSWSILLPKVGEVTRRGIGGRAGPAAVVTELTETGGYVVSAEWADGTTWADPVGALRGQVRESRTGLPVSGAAVSVSGASVVSDSAGRFLLGPIPPGRYRVGITDSAFSGFVRPRQQTRELAVAYGDTASANFEMSSRDALLGDLCRGARHPAGSVAVLGRISDGSGSLPDRLRVEALWFASSGGAATLDLDAVRRNVQETDVNDSGRFVVCGIPRSSSHVTLRAMISAATVADTSLPSASTLVPPVGSTRGLEWLLPAGTFEAAARGDGAVLSGRVLHDGRPLPGAQVWVVLADAMVITDSAGRYRVGGLRAGPQIVQVRRLAYGVRRDTVSLRARDETERDFTLDALELDTVRTIGAARKYDNPRLQDFERRRLAGQGGYFVSEDALRELERVSVPSIIRGHVPGARIETKGGQQYLLSGTTGNINDPSKGCYASIFVDGLVIYDGAIGGRDTPPDLASFMAIGLSGIEFYRGGASLPLQFRSRRNDCGTLLLWTRGK